MSLTSSCRVDELPDEAFCVLASFLTGFDLLKLSNASPALYRDQLRGDSEIWEARATGVTHDQALRAWLQRSRLNKQPQSCIGIAMQQLKRIFRALFSKQPRRQCGRSLYMSRGSLRFPGRQTGRCVRGGAAGIPAQVSSVIQTKPFSIDLWFALQAPRPNVPVGGVLLGAQSKHWTVGDRPRYHRPLIHVDTHGRLYCSTTSCVTTVATSLETNQWYHLVLSYGGSCSSTGGRQLVYLDGKLVHSSTGVPHADMKELQHMQLGAGCVDSDSPENNHPVWYPFNGVLGGCRVWEGGLVSDQLPAMMKEDGAAVPPDAKCLWSLMNDPDVQFYGPVACVQTTRPQERHCPETYSEFQLPGPMVPYIFRRVPVEGPRMPIEYISKQCLPEDE